MPYIDPKRREEIISQSFMHLNTPGELNFAISWLIMEYASCSKFNYQHINDILGALEGAKLEFYRRIAVPYEEQKIKENGDIY